MDRPPFEIGMIGTVVVDGEKYRVKAVNWDGVVLGCCFIGKRPERSMDFYISEARWVDFGKFKVRMLLGRGIHGDLYTNPHHLWEIEYSPMYDLIQLVRECDAG